MLGNSTIWNALAEMPRKLSCKLELSNSNTITDVKLLSYNSDWTGNITVGQVVSSYISVTVPTPNFSLAGVNVTLSMGVGSSVTWTQIGIFKIDEKSIRTRQGYTSFKAYDKLYSAVNSYHSALTYPTTLQSIYAEVCTQIGLTSYPSLTYNPSYTADSEVLEMLDGYNLRDVLGFVAAYQGKNAYLSPTGALEFRWFSSASYTADGTKANVPYIGENNSTVGRLICQTADGVLTSGSGEGIYFTCPFMGQARLAAMVSGLSLTYRKADVDIPYGSYCLQSGDIITVTTVENQTLYVPIMNNSWTYDGGVSSAVSAYDVSDYSGTANNAERSLSVRRVQRQMAVNRATSDLKYATEHITGAAGGYIKIEYGNGDTTARLLVMDQPNIDNALNVWVFNQNGLGHMRREATTDPFGDMNVALTSTGWVAASRISGEMISGVGIENVQIGTSTRPKIVLEQGEIKFQRVAAEPDGSISNIGSIKFNQRSAQEEIDSLSMRVQYGKTVTIGYDNNGSISDQFIYYSDLSAANVPSDAAKFNFWGDLRIFSDLHWISLTDLEKRIEQQRLALAEIVDNGAKNRVQTTIDEIKAANSGSWSGNTLTKNGVTFTINWDLTITISGTTTAPIEFDIILRSQNKTPLKNTKYYCYGDIAGLNENGTNIELAVNRTVNGSGVRYGQDRGEGFEFDAEYDKPIGMWIYLYNAGYSINHTVKPMICEKVYWDISHDYEPYCPTLYELYDMFRNS